MKEIKTISIDIETFSDIDLSKCGVYKYSESENFEILLFAYSINHEEVQVVDLALGEKIPEEIIAALVDDKVTKWAYNANFERVCLSRYLLIMLTLIECVYLAIYQDIILNTLYLTALMRTQLMSF